MSLDIAQILALTNYLYLTIWDRMHEAPIAKRHNKVTRAPIDLRCGYWNNKGNVPLVTVLVRHAYGP